MLGHWTIWSWTICEILFFSKIIDQTVEIYNTWEEHLYQFETFFENSENARRQKPENKFL